MTYSTNTTSTTSTTSTCTVTPVNRIGGRIEQELAIDRKAREIIATPMPDAEREQALAELLRERAILIEHVPVNKLKGGVIFFNMKQIGLAPTPLCSAYNKMRVPTISSYHTIGSNVATILLNPSALEYVPPKILEIVSNLSNKQVDLFCTTIDGRPFATLNGPINLVTHPWAHQHALVNDDTKFDVAMGVFPELGFQDHKEPGSVAFDHITPMEVYVHNDGSMRYSPNNAHFQIVPDSPLGVCWSVAQKDNRVAITKMLVIFDYDHPICEPLINSTRYCNNLDTHLERLKKVEAGIQKTFANVIDLFDREDPNAMIEFKRLPLAFQNGAFKQAWILFGSRCGIHGDFGRASFENDPSLDKQYHCSSKQCAQAIGNFAAELYQLLCASQIDLMLHSQPLAKGDNVLKLMRCAQLFQNNEEKAATEQFEQFSEEEKQAVYFAIWELSKCPRGNDHFGRETFVNPTNLDLKVEALLLAASRLNPHFAIHFELPPSKSIEIPSKEENKDVVSGNLIEPDQIVFEIPLIIEAQEGMDPYQVLEALMALAYSGALLTMDYAERKSRIMPFFNQLSTEIKNKIYGEVYINSTDPFKGGKNWGQEHVADDLDGLISALNAVLGD